jgi:hypothetical protein
MPAPGLTFTYTGTVMSGQAGFDSISVTFESDIAYQAFQCRATKAGEAYGVGVGTLIASFSSTPAATPRTFEIYDDYLVQGDGSYRISLFAQGTDGAWNDNGAFYTSGTEQVMTADGKQFLAVR